MFTSFVVVHSNSTFYIVSMHETVTASHKTARTKEMPKEKLPLRMRTSSYKRPFSYQFNMKCILLFCTAVIAVAVVVFVVGGWVLYSFFSLSLCCFVVVHRSCYYLSMLVSTVNTLDVIVSLMNW